MTRAERIEWQRKRDAFEGPVVEAARRAGRVPVVDCTAPAYPLPPAVAAELARLEHPETREQLYREAAALRRKASSHRSLARALGEKGKEDQARQLVAKAEEHEAHALAVEELVRP
jgi:hypothetical protein